MKYRNEFSAPAEWTGTVVNVGNFSNFNLYCDNTVEVGIGRTSPDIGNYQLVTDCNYIKIQWDGKTVIGLITDWIYINDNNVKVAYSVDAFMSALVSGFIEEMNGICERTNWEPANMLTNMQGEPFAPSDYMFANDELTQSLNNVLKDFEGITYGPSGTSNLALRFILTVSNAIPEYLGISAFDTPPIGITPELKTISDLQFGGADSTQHKGGMFRGIPLVFPSIDFVQQFIDEILAGCGFRTELDPDGYDTQQATTHRSYIVQGDYTAGNVNYSTINEDGDPMEAIRFITVDDIYNLYCIPANFADDGKEMDAHTDFVQGVKTLATLHQWGGEDNAKNKFLNYPYYYNKVKTINGDCVELIPQTHWHDITVLPDPQIWLYLRFVGGDSPRIIGAFAPRMNSGAGSPFDDRSCAEWFTVRNYPGVTLSINDSYNPQVQKDIANIRQTSSTHTNARISNQLSNPIRQGYRDAIDGNYPNNTAQSMWNRLGTTVGYGLGSLDSATGGGNLFKDTAAVEAYNLKRSNEAGNFISPDVTNVMGNDFMTAISMPGFSAWDCGASDTEMFTFSRYIEEFGAALGCYLNPLDDTGDIMGGDGQVVPIDGRTFYQYANIQIKGVMPIKWKENIKALFESGVYLLD